MSGPKFVSPSRIARYYFLECERFLRYSSTPSSDRRAESIPSAAFETRPVDRAVLERGYLWEERALSELLGDTVHIADDATGSTRVRDRAHSADRTNALLATLEPGRSIYQATLRVPTAFYERYGFDPEVVRFSDCRPDLIEAVAGPSTGLRVTDLKASRGLRLSHRIQAALYTLILRDVVADLSLADRQVLLDPAIWLVDDPAPEPFDIRSILPPLEQFLERELGALLARPADAARWHLQPRCESCSYVEHCMAQMHRDDDVSRVPYLTGHAKARLADLEPPVRTVENLRALLADPARRPSLDSIGSMRGRIDRLDNQVRSLIEQRPIAIGANSLAMPVGEHVRIVLSLQTEPVTGHIYCWAVTVQGLRGLIEPNPFTASDVAASSAPDEVRRLERGLVSTLHRLLSAVHDFNAACGEDWKAKKTLQAYVYDTYEVALLTGVLTRGLDDPEIADRAMAVFFHFHRPELIEATEHPQTQAAFPVVVLTSVIRSLLALPVEVTYHFAEVSRLLPRPDRPFEYRDLSFFDYELSNQLRPDAIYGLWHRGEGERSGQIRQVLEARVWAASALVDGVRAALDALAPGALFAWPPKFQLPERNDLRNPLLSRLAFLIRYESLLAYLEVRTARTAPLIERLRDQTTVELVAEENDWFWVVRGGAEFDLDEEAFPYRLLTPATPDGERAALTFADYLYRDRPYPPKNLAVAVAGVPEVSRDALDQPLRVRLDLRRSSTMGPIVPGRRYRLDRRFTDYLSDRAIQELRAIDDDPRSAFLGLLSDPVAASAKLAVPAPIRRTALTLAESHGMTASQAAVFEQVLDRGLTLAWGPPGTGKTHFLGLAILSLAEAHRRHDRPYAVLVSGFTHAAIDNCLRKLADLQADLRVVESGFGLAKLNRFQLSDMTGVELVPAAKAESWLDGHRVAIVGGTAWAIRADVPPGRVNLVVLDEGSQIKVAEAAIVLRRVRPGGRVIIAGDHKQLPPIVQGAYPNPAEGEPLLHRSIFEAFRAADPNGVLSGNLLENFRMNAALCRYPAEQLYDPAYTSATELVRDRLLVLAGVDHGDLADLMIDPAFPLVVAITEDVDSTAENIREAGLVADVAVRLRERLCDPSGGPYEDDRRFWKDGLFVVSPHHVQIRAIRRALRERRSWNAPPFVDTVDKMQGQECDAVITSYGVADVEYAMNEQEFIYSLNRLNVATTRGRAKTIVFLSRALLEPPIAAFETDRVAEGIAFMQGLAQFAERHGTTSTIELPDNTRLTLHRLPAAVGDIVAPALDVTDAQSG